MIVLIFDPGTGEPPASLGIEGPYASRQEAEQAAVGFRAFYPSRFRVFILEGVVEVR